MEISSKFSFGGDDREKRHIILCLCNMLQCHRANAGCQCNLLQCHPANAGCLWNLYKNDDSVIKSGFHTC